MGNFIFGYDFVDPSLIIPSTEASGYDADNVVVYGFTKRHWRSTVITASSLVFDFSTAQALTGVAIIDINATTNIVVQGNDTNVWSSPSYNSGNLQITQNPVTKRYNRYIPLTAFNYRWLRIWIEGQTPTDSAAYFRVGTVAFLDTSLTLALNPIVPYTYSADEAIKINKFESGGDERIKLGDQRWKGSFAARGVRSTSEADYWTLNSITKNENIIFYENGTDTAAVYICRRDTPIEVVWEQGEIFSVPTLTFKEIY